MSKGICKLTGREGKFVKAHLYPKAFYKLDGPGPLTTVSNAPGERPKRAPVGVYDAELVIEETEKWFAQLDNHAARFLKAPLRRDDFLRWNGRVHFGDDGLPLGYQIRGFDPDLMRLFFMSVLWRFGASARPETQAVNLGPHLEVLRHHLARKEAPKGHQYSVVGSRFVDEQHMVVLTPTRFRLDGVNTWHMVFGNYEFYMKTDARPFPTPWNSLSTMNDGNMSLLLRRFRDSRLWDTLAADVKAVHAKYGDPWGRRFANNGKK